MASGPAKAPRTRAPRRRRRRWWRRSVIGNVCDGSRRGRERKRELGTGSEVMRVFQILGVNGQYRDQAAADYFFGDGAEEGVGDAPAPVRSDDDQVEAVFGALDELDVRGSGHLLD